MVTRACAAPTVFGFVQVIRFELCLRLFFTATCTRDQLAKFAAISAISEVGGRFPLCTVSTKLGAFASIAHLGGISLLMVDR